MVDYHNTVTSMCIGVDPRTHIQNTKDSSLIIRIWVCDTNLITSIYEGPSILSEIMVTYTASTLWLSASFFRDNGPTLVCSTGSVLYNGRTDFDWSDMALNKNRCDTVVLLKEYLDAFVDINYSEFVEVHNIGSDIPTNLRALFGDDYKDVILKIKEMASEAMRPDPDDIQLTYVLSNQ